MKKEIIAFGIIVLFLILVGCKKEMVAPADVQEKVYSPKFCEIDSDCTVRADMCDAINKKNYKYSEQICNNELCGVFCNKEENKCELVKDCGAEEEIEEEIVPEFDNITTIDEVDINSTILDALNDTDILADFNDSDDLTVFNNSDNINDTNTSNK